MLAVKRFRLVSGDSDARRDEGVEPRSSEGIVDLRALVKDGSAERPGLLVSRGERIVVERSERERDPVVRGAAFSLRRTAAAWD
jgi:hypothetical protein